MSSEWIPLIFPTKRKALKRLNYKYSFPISSSRRYLTEPSYKYDKLSLLQVCIYVQTKSLLVLMENTWFQVFFYCNVKVDKKAFFAFICSKMDILETGQFTDENFPVFLPSFFRKSCPLYYCFTFEFMYKNKLIFDICTTSIIVRDLQTFNKKGGVPMLFQWDKNGGGCVWHLELR